MKILREAGNGVFLSQVLMLQIEDDDDTDVDAGTYAIDSTGRVWKLNTLFSEIVSGALALPPDDRPKPGRKRRVLRGG